MMADVRILPPDERAAWDAQVAALHGHLLQSWAWGELKAQFGWRVERVVARSSGAQVLYRSLPAGLGTLAYVPKGPMGDLRDPAILPALLQRMRTLARRKRAICLTIEPDLEDDPTLAARLQGLGFRPSPQTIQPRRTILVALDGEPDLLLARMKQKTRYNIRLATRHGVIVRPGADTDLVRFYRLLEATAERDQFGIHTQAYYETAHRLLVSPRQGCLLLAEFEGRLLAGLVVVAQGDIACYMYGASSEDGRNLMPTYLLQWEAMLWAQAHGCRIYDLWGVPDEDETTLEEQFNQRPDGLWGVYRFKRGFGGRLVRTIGAWDLVYSPVRYRLYAMVLKWLNQRRAG